MNHISDFHLQEYIDNLLNENERLIVSTHIHECSRCSERYHIYLKFNHAIKRIPLVNVSTGFTDNVMATIGVKDTPSFAWKVLTNLAPLVMATIILLIIAGALYISGAWNNTEFSHAAGITKSSYQVVSTWISQGTHQLNTWLLKIFPFHFTNNGIMLTVFLLCFFSAIGLMDKYLFANLMKRKQP